MYCHSGHGLNNELKVRVGCHGLMVLALDCGAGDPRFESWSPSFFRERPSTRGKKKWRRGGKRACERPLTSERARNQGPESKDLSVKKRLDTKYVD